MHFSKYNNALMLYYKSNNKIMQYFIVSHDIALIMHYRALLQMPDTYYAIYFNFFCIFETIKSRCLLREMQKKLTFRERKSLLIKLFQIENS